MWMRRLLFLFSLIPLGAGAQVVNIEGRRFLNDTVPWTGYVDFRLNVTENTQRSNTFGFGGAVQHVRGKHRFFFINDLALSRVEHNDFLNTGFQHLRYNYARDKRWTGEAFAQTQYNKPLLLDLRATLGAGPRLRVVNEEKYRMYVGTSVMAEYENTSLDEAFFHARNSSYLSMYLKLDGVASVSTVLYYQPRLFDASDHRVALEGSLLLTIGGRYTFESRMNLLKDTGQPEGVPYLSYSWNNRFGYRF
jgi:hypothetical protein